MVQRARRPARLPAALLLAAVAAAIGLLPAAASAQSISGYVVEEGTSARIPFAEVTLIDSAGAAGVTAAADSTGYFRIGARPGKYRVRVERIGYTSHTSDVILLNAGEPVMIELRMAARGVPLEALVIEARGREQGRVGFVRRRELGLGTFMTTDSVKLRHPRLVTDAFRAADGIGLAGFGLNARIMSFKGEQCMAIFVDHDQRPYAMFMPRHTTQYMFPPTLAVGAEVGSAAMLNRMFRPEDIEGIEVYAEYSEVPKELRTAHRTTDIYPCGFAIIWTKRDW